MKDRIRKETIRETKDFYNPEDDGREVILEWSRKRIQNMKGFNKSYYGCLVYTFNLSTLKSFVENFNFMVITQMFIAALGVYLFDRYDVYYGFSASLFVSPIVFPLAFSINTDFQRREKVLDDLANFKSSSMLWFFCMREWKDSAELSDEWMNSIKKKTHSMLFNAREYLLTSRRDRRSIIAQYMYEDYSDASQLIETLRASKLPQNPALISRAYHLLNGLCLSFERLRVIREYRSPRSIRSFNKVLVLLLPIMLCPYFVSLSRSQGANKWGPYFIAVLVAGVFGALQGVQDKLDDPFDGMSEDDIKLDTLDEWTFNSLEVVAQRKFSHHSTEKADNTEENKKMQNKKVSTPRYYKRIPYKKEFKSQHIVELLKEMRNNEEMKYQQRRQKNTRKRIIKNSRQGEEEQDALLLGDLKDGRYDYQNPSKVRKKTLLREHSISDEKQRREISNVTFSGIDDEEYYDVIQNGNVSMEEPLLSTSIDQEISPPFSPFYPVTRDHGVEILSPSIGLLSGSQLKLSEGFTVITINDDSPRNGNKKH